MNNFISSELIELEALVCAHCGLPAFKNIVENGHYYCCYGCKTAHSFLSETIACPIPNFGTGLENDDLSYLDKPEILEKWTIGKTGNSIRVRFQIPGIHCASCVQVLERLYLRKHGVVASQVNFLKKELEVSFQPEALTFSQLVQYISGLGYKPNLAEPGNESQNKQKSETGNWTLRLAVAGFCSANIMLLSFPEYLGLEDSEYRHFFGWINLIVAMPAVFFSGWIYFQSVINAFTKRVLNIDVPIGVGMLATLVLSLYEIISQTGSGYFDSLTGLIFFLLIGRWVQSRTFEFLSFERDFKSYFPLSIVRILGAKEEQILSSEVKAGDILKIRNGEIIPCDGIMLNGNALIDYSFVTGESRQEKVEIGLKLMAGGKQTSGAIAMLAEREMSRSQLTTLWNNPVFQKEGKPLLRSFTDSVAYYFTPVILIFAASVALFWAFVDPSKSLYAFLSVLIIACPCTLSLAYPIALGNAMRIWGKSGFFLKNADVVERLAQTKTLVFDKTGTLTNHLGIAVSYIGEALSEKEIEACSILFSSSQHPLSQAISQYLQVKSNEEIIEFSEEKGNGISGICYGLLLKAGSAKWLKVEESQVEGSVVFLSINEKPVGRFEIKAKPFPFVEKMLGTLSQIFKLHLLSGDRVQGQEFWSNLFQKLKGKVSFGQNPENKLAYIEELQAKGEKVSMIGDGLNDAGALRQANVGIAIAANSHQFTPGSDAILLADNINLLPNFLSHAKNTMAVVKFCFLLSVIYNVVGLSFAVRGDLQPIVAAILMPLSSLTVVLVAWVGTGMKFRNQAEPN